MSIEPITEDFHCPHCNTGRIGKIVTQDLKKPRKLSGRSDCDNYIYLFEVVEHSEPRIQGIHHIKDKIGWPIT